MPKLASRRGDTLIEVLFAITIFALVAVTAVNLMNGGIYTAQKSLEITMARNEIDAQAEALRYIQNSYLAEREHAGGIKQFQKLWSTLTNPSVAKKPTTELAQSFNNMKNCSEAYNGTGSRPGLFNLGAFVLNTRMLQPENAGSVYNGDLQYKDLLNEMIVGAKDAGDKYRLRPAEVYPRIIYSIWGNLSVYDPNSSSSYLKEAEMYRKIAVSEGIWIIPVAGGTVDSATKQPEYYDFHIRTCWHSVGRVVPSTIGTIVRLYNPEVIESERR
jgi:prepilin-type N-terminal cleavage/methylation domain-containing protein